jgi:hypothetical protein
MWVKHFHLVIAAALVACASGGSDPGTLPNAPTARKSNVLTFAEMSEAHADVATAYEALARLRPNWLASHGVTSTVASGGGTEYASVFVDGQPYGDLASLRNIPAYHVTEFRYYSITEAGARFGLRAGSSGVIEVIMNLRSGS